MRALVTGSTGFIGGHLVRRLLADGAGVRAVVRSMERGEGLARLGAELWEADLGAPADLGGALAGTDVVFHLAGRILPTGDGSATYRRANVEATGRLLAACRDHPLAAFVHVSSVGAMGRLRRLPADETADCAPDSPYGRTKYEGERLARRAHAEEGLPVVVARPAWVYGPGDRRTLRLFAAIRQRRFPMVGSGATWVHPVYVDDVVEGLLRCATEPKAIGQTYLLAGPESVRLRTLVALIADLVGVAPPRITIPVWAAWLGAAAAEGIFGLLRRRPPLYRRQLEFFVRDQLFSTAKAREGLHFVAAMSLRDGLTRTIAWYREHGLLA